MRFTTTLILLAIAGAVFWWIRTVDEDVEAAPAPRSRLVDEEILTGFEEAEFTLLSKEVLKVVREPGGRFPAGRGRAGVG